MQTIPLLAATARCARPVRVRASRPVDGDGLRAWVEGYERAWRTRGTAPLADLFAADATYRTAPFNEPHRGLDAIATMWEAERTSPDEVFALDAEVVAVEGDTGVARLEVRYGDPVRRVYRDLWIVRFDDEGRCIAFEEWPFWPPGSGGAAAAPPAT